MAGTGLILNELGGGIIDPSWYGADLLLWLRADLGITLSGSDITRWEDQSPVPSRWVPRSPMVQSTSAVLNGQTIIPFLDAFDCTVSGTSSGDDWSIIFVAEFPNNAGAHPQFRLIDSVGIGFRLEGAGDETTLYVAVKDDTHQADLISNDLPGAGSVFAGAVILSSSPLARANGSPAGWVGWNPDPPPAQQISLNVVPDYLTVTNYGMSLAEFIIVNRAGGCPELAPYLKNRYNQNW